MKNRLLSANPLLPNWPELPFPAFPLPSGCDGTFRRRPTGTSHPRPCSETRRPHKSRPGRPSTHPSRSPAPHHGLPPDACTPLHRGSTRGLHLRPVPRASSSAVHHDIRPPASTRASTRASTPGLHSGSPLRVSTPGIRPRPPAQRSSSTLHPSAPRWPRRGARRRGLPQGSAGLGGKAPSEERWPSFRRSPFRRSPCGSGGRGRGGGRRWRPRWSPGWLPGRSPRWLPGRRPPLPGRPGASAAPRA